MSVKTGKDYGLSVARLIATLFIITCHIMQVEKMTLALWFNVGVQMFLYMSGYLYGRYRDIDPAGFMYARLKRLLIGFYVFSIPFSVILLATKVYPIGWVDIVHFLTFSNFNFADGIGHLWFVPCIIVCYMMLTLLISILNKMDAIKSDAVYIAASIALMLGVEFIFQLFIRNEMMKSPWINCFVVGVVLRRISESDRRLKDYIGYVILFGCLVMNAAQIVMTYVLALEFESYKLFLFDRICDYAHMLLGIVLVEIIRRLFANIGSDKVKSFLDTTDRLSYSVYLVHFVLIKGAFSLLKVISPKALAVVAIYVSAILIGILIDAITNMIQKRL